MCLAGASKGKRVKADPNILTEILRQSPPLSRSEALKHSMSRPFLKKGVNHKRPNNGRTSPTWSRSECT
jgi:hypothetical protein